MQNETQEIQTLIYVENYQAFVAKHGAARLDKNIALAFNQATGKKNVTRVVSSIQKGFIFAWESPFPSDVQKDFAFALNIDYAAILSEFNSEIRMNNVNCLYAIA